MIDKSPFSQEWTKMQQEFWDMYDSQQKIDGLSLNQWLGNMDDWWKTQSTDVPTSVNSLYKKLHFTSQYFVNFAEPFLSANDSKADPGGVLVKYLEAYLQAIEDNTGNNDIKGFWKLPFDMWKQQFEALGGIPEDFTALIQHSLEDNSFTEEFTKASQSYLEALKQYQSAFVSMTMQAATILIEELQKLEDNEPSCRDICNLWIDLFDKHYADFVSANNYPKLYADVINNWMLLIQQSEQLIAPWLKAMNMPVKEDIDRIKASQQELLDENRALKNKLNPKS